MSPAQLLAGDVVGVDGDAGVGLVLVGQKVPLDGLRQRQLPLHPLVHLLQLARVLAHLPREKLFLHAEGFQPAPVQLLELQHRARKDVADGLGVLVEKEREIPGGQGEGPHAGQGDHARGMARGINDDGHLTENGTGPELHDVSRRFSRKAAAHLHASLGKEVDALRRLGLADDGVPRGKLFRFQQVRAPAAAGLP